MIFAKIDVEQSYSHDKFVAAGPAAVGYWAMALCWIRGHETDGLLPDNIIGLILGVGRADAAALCDQLVAVGLFARRKTGYELLNYAAKNETKARIAERREQEKQRKQDWRKGRGGSMSLRDSGRDTNVPDATVPPSVPVPGTPGSGSGSGSGSKSLALSERGPGETLSRPSSATGVRGRTVDHATNGTPVSAPSALLDYAKDAIPKSNRPSYGPIMKRRADDKTKKSKAKT